MASKLFEDIFAEAMKKNTKVERINQALLISSSVEQKKISLSSTIAVRRADGEDISEADLLAAEDSAEAYVDALVDEMALMDLDALIKYDKRTKKKLKAPGESIKGLRRSTGQFIKPATLQSLLNITLYKYVQGMMGSPRLNNRTGRLAHSGVVTEISSKSKKNDRISLYFRYMTAPYSVFEPGSGNPRASEARSPQELFRDALNNALTDILNPASKARISVFWRR